LRENTNQGLSSIAFALVHTLKRNSPPVTFAGSRQGHPLAWHSACAAASTAAVLTALARATLPSSPAATKCALMPRRGRWSRVRCRNASDHRSGNGQGSPHERTDSGSFGGPCPFA
jgi:hypothetical protein